MSKEYDVLVVGAGHNSLSTAAYLAKSGLSVCVFEKNEQVGGGAVSREVTAPGFMHDTHATGIILAMHYKPDAATAFASVEHIMRDVNFGWLLRYAHANGASMFFIVVYIHLFRGLYYGSYKAPRELLWMLGVVILLLMMATGFLGYTLPWGQMSFWGATVITNLFSAIPGVGDAIVTWLWGGFSVDNPTLNRFFVLHFLLPFGHSTPPKFL